MRFEAGKTYKTTDFTHSELGIIAKIRKWMYVYSDSYSTMYNIKRTKDVVYMFAFHYNADGDATDWRGGIALPVEVQSHNDFTIISRGKTILCNFDVE
jgi:hypothetical protein